MFLHNVYFGNSVQDWITAAAIGFGVFFLLKIIRRIVIRRLGKIATRTDTVIDDLVVEVLKKTRFFFFASVALYFGARVVALDPSHDRWLQIFIAFLILVQVALWGNTIISFLLAQAIRQRTGTDASNATTLGAIGVIAKIALFSIVLLVGLDNFGVNITGLITGLGIGGIAVALALQKILGDLFASLSIALDKPFVIGDFVVVGEHKGTVEHIGLKTTRVKSISGEQIIFSNGDLLDSRVRNFERMQERRALFTIGVTYQTPHDKLSAIPGMLRAIIEARSDTRFERAHFKKYDDSALTFEVVYFVLNPDYNTYMDVQQAINLEIFKHFGERGIEFAYPTRTLHLQDRADAPGRTAASALPG